MSIPAKVINPVLAEIFSNYPVEFGYIFGSHASGEAGPLSDLDIAVYLDYQLPEPAQEEVIEDIRADIEKAFQMPDKVDVILLNQELPPFLERNVVYDGKLMYIKNDIARTYYEADVIKRWLDWQPYHERYMNEILYAS